VARRRVRRAAEAAPKRTARRRDGNVDGGPRVRRELQKKTVIAREQDRPDVAAKRRTFVVAQSALNPQRLVFVDEAGFRLGAPPNYGWAPVGDKSLGKATHGDWCTMTMIGALALDGWRGFVTIDAATDGDVFRAFVEQQLVGKLHAGELVVMDNLNAHKDTAAVRAIRAVGADVLFLPPYSPEYNPIEKAWAKLKDLLRRAHTITRDTFDSAVASAMAAITASDIGGWTLHSGYALSSI
jgi:transposase